jgi:tetratricopeptide (TPR) repeat protein
MSSQTDAQFAPEVFICYMREDVDVAEELYAYLKSAGADPWLDRKNLVYGDDYESEIRNAIRQSELFVACLRPGFDEKGFRQREVRWALAEAERRPPGKAFMIPFIVEPCELPDWANRIHAGADLSRRTMPFDILRAIDKHCGTALASSAREDVVLSPGEKLVVPPQTDAAGELLPFATLTPTGATGELLPFAALNEYAFQDFCCALLERDQFVRSCEIYGVRGQRQRGIDLKGSTAADNGRVVGQCKHYERITAAQVRSASDEFFKHWDYWKSRGVRRFILLVSCRMDTTQLRDQIDEEIERFSEEGIAYEVWHQRRLTEKARSTPDLVDRFFHPYGYLWNQVIGAEPVPASAFRGSGGHLMEVVQSSVVEQLVEVSDLATGERVAGIRSLIEKGLVTTAHQELQKLKDSAAWKATSPETRASALRVEAGLSLQEPDRINEARVLAGEARRLDPDGDERTLQAVFARVRSGPEAAFAELSGAPTLRVLNLRAQLQLEMGNPEACEQTIKELMGSFEPDAETYRTQGLLSLVRRDVGSALQATERAVELRPDSAMVRLTLAVSYFWSSVTPAALPGRLLALPPPIDPRFVLQDAASQERLSIAAQHLCELLESGAGPALGEDALVSWRVACLANATAKQEEARALCAEALQGPAPSPSVVRWACARRWVTDLEKLVKKLRVEYEANNPEQVEVVVQCLLTAGKTQEALHLLRSAKSEFLKTGNEKAFDLLQLECLCQLGDEQEISAAAKGAEDARFADQAKLLVTRSSCDATGDFLPLAQELETQWSRKGEPRLLLDLCELKAAARDWYFVAEHGEALLQAIQTPPVLLLYAMALYNTGQYERCLTVVSAHASLFADGSISSRLLVIRASAQRALGLVSPALNDARRALDQDPSEDNLMIVLMLLYKGGDREALIVEGRQLLKMDDAGVSNLIWLAQVTKGYSSAFAKRALGRALSRSVPNSLVASALQLSFDLLGSDDERTSILISRAVELGKQGIGGFLLASQSELEDLVQDRAQGIGKAFELYSRGQIPLHLLSDTLNEPLGAVMPLLFFSSQNEFEARRTIPFLRSGRASRLPGRATITRMLTDITALLVGEALGIVDAVETDVDTIAIPFHSVTGLQAAEDRLVQMQRQRGAGSVGLDEWIPTMRALIERLRGGIEAGNYVLLPEFPGNPDENSRMSGLNVLCLRELLLAETQVGDLVWSDDRYLNGHAMMGVAPIASTYDLLAHLQVRGALTQEERFHANRRLRSWRCLFLPLEKEEIVHTVVQGDSNAMRLLKEWVATTYLHGAELQIDPSATPPDVGEFRCFLDLHRAIEDSIIDIWADQDVKIEVRQERATWVLNELLASALTVRRQTQLPRDQENPLRLEALTVSALFTRAFLQLRPAEWKPFFGWLDRHVLEPRAKSEPLFVRATAEGITSMLLNKEAWSEFGFGEQEKELLAFFTAHLPERLKLFVLENQEIRDELGFSETVSIQGFDFTADEFYRGMAQVQADGMAELELLGRDASVSVAGIGKLPAQEFTLRDRDGAEIGFTGEELVLLHGSMGEQRAFLEERRHWFDCSRQEFDQQVGRIVADPSPRRRAEAARKAKSSSVAEFYKALRARLSESGRFDLRSLLPPDTSSGIHYFGLSGIKDDESSFQEQLSSAAGEMLQELPISEVLARFDSMPSPLPHVLQEELAELGPDECQIALDRTLGATRSPIGIFHVARLMQENLGGSERSMRGESLILSTLTPEGREEAQLFLRVLAWTESQLAYDRVLDSAPVAVRVALPWAYASELHSAFMDAGADPKKLRQIFEDGRSAELPANLLSADVLFAADVSRARTQSVERLLVSGGVFALGTSHDYGDELADQLADLLFMETDEGRTLRLAFWQDFSGASDALNSFLAGSWEEKLKPLLGEASERIGRIAAAERIGVSLSTIRDNKEERVRAWTTLQAVLGDLPAPSKWGADLSSCLVEADLRPIARENATIGVMAYYFACGQARFLGDERAIRNLADQVGDLARAIDPRGEDQEDLASWLLLDAILRLASTALSPTEGSEMAATLAQTAIRHSEALASLWESAIWALANRLPLAQGQSFWPLLLKIRAAAVGEA